MRHAGDELANRRHLFRLDELLLQHLLVGDVADEAEHFLVLLRRRVGDRNCADLAVLAVELRVEQSCFAGERLLEVGKSLREVVVREHGREPLTDQLLAPVSGDVFGRVVDRGEAAVRVQGDDRVGRRFHQVAVAGFGARQRLLGAFGLCDVAQRGDGADDLAVHPEGPTRDRDVPLFARAVIDDARLVPLHLTAENAVFA